jgi:glyoxylase-like metal-dependent hydrolase (beta-lactamase superfamily II)
VKAATGATVLAEGPHRAARPLNVGEAPRLDASNDTDFKPDRALADGEVVEGSGWSIEAVATPGHTANHMAYALRGANVLFSGDHVMAWSTPVVAPPDGSMGDYMASLEKLRVRTEPVYLPGHGGAVTNAPRFVAAYILHRRAREAAIVNWLAQGESDIPTIVEAIYANLDPRLKRAAAMSVLAHLEDLVARGAVVSDGPASIARRYRVGG